VHVDEPDKRKAFSAAEALVGKKGRENSPLIGLILERATHQSLSHYLQETLGKPRGMEAAGSWSLDSTQDGFEKSESGLNARAIDFANFGQFFLQRGT
jgi:CubicO group peptidase (beta-lactamase class C family)